MARPTEQVAIVVARMDMYQGPSRYLTATYFDDVSPGADPVSDPRVLKRQERLPRRSTTFSQQSKPSINHRQVLATFADRDSAAEACACICVPGDKYICSLPLQEAAYLAFKQLNMDLVVVYTMPSAAATEWEIYYASRTSSLAQGSAWHGG